MALRASETAVGYHGGSICLDFDHGHAGDRAPGWVLVQPDGTRARLHELLRSGKFVLLFFSGWGDEYLEFAEETLNQTAGTSFGKMIECHAVLPARTGIEDVSDDPAEQAARLVALHDIPGEIGYKVAFGVKHASACLTRPDGCIGSRASARAANTAIAAWRKEMEGV